MAKAPRLNIRGIAVFPSINKPDFKFATELGMYKADVRLSLEDAKPHMERLSKLYKEWTGNDLKPTKTNLWKFEEDSEGERTGQVVFSCKVKNVRTKKGEVWDRKPKQYDTQNNVINEQVWGGTEYIVGAEVYQWTAGVDKGISLQPVAVQIIDLVGPSEGADGGFDAVDDGYVGGFNADHDTNEPEAAVAGDADDGNTDF